MLTYALFFAVFNLGFRILHKTHPDVLGYATDIRVEQLLKDTNDRRIASGLSPLKLNTELSDAAAHKAIYMFQKNFWAHVAPDGKTPWDFILASGYSYTMAGENLAKNFSTSDAVVDAWMASQSHKENLLKPGYQDVGFAVVNGVLNGEETTLVVQMFGATKMTAALPKPVAVIPTPATAPQTVSQTPSVVLLNETTPATVAAGQPSNIPGFIAAFRKPVFDLPTTTRVLAFGFGGFILSVLLIDAYIVAKKRIVRISGHTIAHMLFLGAIVIGELAILQGAVL